MFEFWLQMTRVRVPSLGARGPAGSRELLPQVSHQVSHPQTGVQGSVCMAGGGWREEGKGGSDQYGAGAAAGRWSWGRGG